MSDDLCRCSNPGYSHSTASHDLTEAERAIEKRVRDWLGSTSESYFTLGSEPWIAGLAGYILRGPGSLEPLLADLCRCSNPGYSHSTASHDCPLCGALPGHQRPEMSDRPLIQARVADAWDEGYHAGAVDQNRWDATPNPYCQEPA